MRDFQNRALPYARTLGQKQKPYARTLGQKQKPSVPPFVGEADHFHQRA